MTSRRQSSLRKPPANVVTTHSSEITIVVVKGITFMHTPGVVCSLKAIYLLFGIRKNV